MAGSIRVVDLFAGCGGLTLGIAQAAHAMSLRLEVLLAVDFEDSAVQVYKANFPHANAVTASVESYFDGELGAPLSTVEATARRAYTDVTVLVGGPPCQGHSNLNNKTRRRDPKNELYARMARAAEVLRPKYVVIENVPSVRLDTDQVVQRTAEHLESLKYDVASGTVALHPLGVAQKRRRHVLVASADPDVPAGAILRSLQGQVADPEHDLRWAIGDLMDMTDRVGYDIAPKPSTTNTERMQFLLDSDLYDLPNDRRPTCHQDGHRYTAMYGRLKWSEPAQTITSGFGSIGQGRYMHPDLPRALTAHEAARIQGFPDYFDFVSVTRRTDLATMIGNAVPPALMRAFTLIALSSPRDDPNDRAATGTLGAGSLQERSVQELVPA